MKTLKFMLAAAILAFPATANAQKKTYWRIPSTLGGVMVGAGAGWSLDIMRWASASSCGLCGPTLTATPIGMAAGGVFGFLAGRSADQALERGDSLATMHRRWLRVATFLTPPVIGSTVAYLIIDGEDQRCVPNPFSGCTYEEPKKIADDETVALVGIGGGVVLGWVLQEMTKGALRPQVTAGTGSLGLSFTHTF